VRRRRAPLRPVGSGPVAAPRRKKRSRSAAFLLPLRGHPLATVASEETVGAVDRGLGRGGAIAVVDSSEVVVRTCPRHIPGKPYPRVGWVKLICSDCEPGRPGHRAQKLGLLVCGKLTSGYGARSNRTGQGCPPAALRTASHTESPACTRMGDDLSDYLTVYFSF